jgi:hypothetical protein
MDGAPSATSVPSVVDVQPALVCSFTSDDFSHGLESTEMLIPKSFETATLNPEADTTVTPRRPHRIIRSG